MPMTDKVTVFIDKDSDLILSVSPLFGGRPPTPPDGYRLIVFDRPVDSGQQVNEASIKADYEIKDGALSKKPEPLVIPDPPPQ